jgi:HSP20 family molecular chaperone IbpA
MAFPRFYNEQGFAPLFRLLDDFDTYSRQQGGNTHKHHRSIPTFQPRFDVRELEDSYELHGELPGMKKEEVEIQFSDPQTMLIRGRIERSYQAGTPPAGLVEGSSSGGAITEKGEEHKKPHKATVEDEEMEGAATPSSTAEPTEVVKQDNKEKKPKDMAKYWVSERSIGEFSRSFNFPGHIDQNGVKASFKDGILSIVVPKAKKPEAFRVTIN